MPMWGNGGDWMLFDGWCIPRDIQMDLDALCGNYWPDSPARELRAEQQSATLHWAQSLRGVPEPIPPPTQAAPAGHCPKGHPYTLVTIKTGRYAGTTSRQCRECQYQRYHLRREQQ
jgi:hypothetical protein